MGPRGRKGTCPWVSQKNLLFLLQNAMCYFLSPFSAWLMRPPPTFCGAAPSSCLGRRGTPAASSAGRPRRTPGWHRGPANSKFRLHATDWRVNLNLIILILNFDAYNDLTLDALFIFLACFGIAAACPTASSSSSSRSDVLLWL